MSRLDRTEEQAKILFAKQLGALAAEGSHPDCDRIIADIFAENEAECARMEQLFSAAESEAHERRLFVGS